MFHSLLNSSRLSESLSRLSFCFCTKYCIVKNRIQQINECKYFPRWKINLIWGCILIRCKTSEWDDISKLYFYLQQQNQKVIIALPKVLNIISHSFFKCFSASWLCSSCVILRKTVSSASRILENCIDKLLHIWLVFLSYHSFQMKSN